MTGAVLTVSIWHNVTRDPDGRQPASADSPPATRW
jgi:hypothetical protein